ncbi:unnamed protein product, partial [Ceratitis capitata]
MSDRCSTCKEPNETHMCTYKNTRTNSSTHAFSISQTIEWPKSPDGYLSSIAKAGWTAGGRRALFVRTH